MEINLDSVPLKLANDDLTSAYRMLSKEDLASHVLAAEDIRNPGRAALTENQKTLRDEYAKLSPSEFQEHYNALLAAETMQDDIITTSLQALIKALEDGGYDQKTVEEAPITDPKDLLKLLEHDGYSKPTPCQYAKVSPPFQPEQAESINTWFGKLAWKLVDQAQAARKRFRFYQFFGSEPGFWAFLPILKCEVVRDGSVYPEFRYGVTVGWLFWAVEFGFGRVAKKVCVKVEGKPDLVDDFRPDEANERP